MFEEKFKNELLTFLPKEDVELIENDFETIINKFPLDAKKKNYLNILINIFLRYRTQINEPKDIVNKALFQIGLNPKEITIKQNKMKISALEFKNTDFYFTKTDLVFLDKFFNSISFSVTDSTNAIDFTKGSIEQRLSYAINEHPERIFDINGIFYSYINVSLETVKNEMVFPEKMKNDEVIEKVYSMIRFYAWVRSSLSWSSYVTSGKDVESIAENYQALQWFLDGYIKRSTPFNSHSPKRYMQYLETIKAGDANQHKKRIDDIFNFTSILINNVKEIYSLLSNAPFAIQKENKSNLFDIFAKVIGLQFTQTNNYSFTVQSVVDFYKTLQTIFFELNLSTEEFYELSNANIINSLLITIIKQIQDNLLPVEFPFSLIWENKKEKEVNDFLQKYSLSLEGNTLQLLEFLIEYTQGGITSNNFNSYFSKLETIMKLQDDLLKIGDIADFESVKFEDAEYLSNKSETYDFIDLKKLKDLEGNIRQSLNILKRIWVHDICGDPIFMNDPLFKKTFPLNLGKDKIEYVSELVDYLKNWDNYKNESKIISKIKANIKVISTIKLKLEGQELVTSDYPGAVSLIKAQKLVSRESLRLIIKLKDIISSVAKFKYVDGFTNKLDQSILSQSDDKIISQSLEILDLISLMKDELSSIAIDSLIIELKTFSSFVVQLLGSESRILQLNKYSETLQARHKKMSQDPVIINTSLHFININEVISNIISIVKETNGILERFYSNSLSKEIFDHLNIVTKSKNLSEIISSMKLINENLQTVVTNLSKLFSDISTYFDVLADIAFQMVQNFGRLIARNDFFVRIENAHIKYYDEDNSIVITDKIDEKESILAKQMFLEKTFSLFTTISRGCSQITFAITKSFNNVITHNPVTLEKLDKGMEISKKIEIVTKSVDQIYKFFDSVKLPSKNYIQLLKNSLKSIQTGMNPIPLTSQLVAELSNANKLINAISKTKGVNFGLLRKLNESLNRILRFIDNSSLLYFKDELTEESKKKEYETILYSNEVESDSFISLLNKKLKTLKVLTSINKNKIKTTSINDLISVITPTSIPVQESKSDKGIELVDVVEEPEVAIAVEEPEVVETFEESEEVEAVEETKVVETVEESEEVETFEESEVVEAFEKSEVIEAVEEPNVVEAFEEPEINQLEDKEDDSSLELESEDTYESEIEETSDSEDDSKDLISEMEKLLNVKKNKSENE